MLKCLPFVDQESGCFCWFNYADLSGNNHRLKALYNINSQNYLIESKKMGTIFHNTQYLEHY